MLRTVDVIGGDDLNPANVVVGGDLAAALDGAKLCASCSTGLDLAGSRRIA
jgi:hypothetical protein